MLDQILKVFKIEPDYDLNIFKHGQTLSEITCKSVMGIEGVIKEFRPDLLLVQGDTTAVFAGALAAFYNDVKIGHVEAGLRSGDLYSPYPEEANRKLTGILTDLHFAPTEQSKQNLLNEGYDKSKIFITGNTEIDSLYMVLDKNYKFEDEIIGSIDFENKKVIVMTAHRRENIGKNMENIFEGIKAAVENNKDVEVIYAMHKNPEVRRIAYEILGNNERIHLTEPIDYLPFINLIAKSYMVITDSGGIQESAPALGKPVLVARRETERPEGILAGTARLIGVDRDEVYKHINLLINDKEEYAKMANAVNPYGDGTAAENIVKIIKENQNI